MILPLFLLLFQDPAEREQEELRQALAEAGSSQVDFIRAVERHLARYPNSSQRAEIERSAARAAIELRDSRRILLYGERVLAREPNNVELLERVSRNLLSFEDKASSTRALEYSKRLLMFIEAMPVPQSGEKGAGRRTEERAIFISKALVYQARATGNLGNWPEAEALARRSYSTLPSAESAREIARWLERQAKTEAALAPLADAFMILDPNSELADRAKDRARLGEWARKVYGSEDKLGPMLVAAWDRTQGHIHNFRESLRKIDVNADAQNTLDFTLPGLGGESLQLATLKGKCAVFDFWATWCGPCRAQQPLYEQVQTRFKSQKDVVFLNVSTDENRDLVKPFLDRNGWKKTVYFEDGLATLLRVSSIPTTVVINRRGEIASRMNGYIADRFVDMLTERIEQCLADK